ncbi:hypothetical protein [Sphingobacterium sp. UBA7631]|uniref:hypothetical protein n=1 Tax=Sphingobacterium sp. UBA7631 TaxID=1947523 RepID=UPI00257ACBF0|nr:hypothetical protein [Sphingobacterium sp. UBA7631]
MLSSYCVSDRQSQCLAFNSLSSYIARIKKWEGLDEGLPLYSLVQLLLPNGYMNSNSLRSDKNSFLTPLDFINLQSEY